MFKIIIIILFISINLYADEKYFLETPAGGDFSLETSLSKKFKLSDLKGKTVFIFFGFRACPNICPFTVQRLKELQNYLLKKKNHDAHFLFISVDNERDTLEDLTKYAQTNGPLFSAGTGNDEQLRSIMSLFGAYFSKTKNRSNQTIVNHSDNVFVISPSGSWVETLKFDSTYKTYLEAYMHSKTTQPTIGFRSQIQKKIEIKSLGKKYNCDLGKEACESTLPDMTKIKVSFTPRPIKVEKTFSIKIESNSKKYIPESVDFVGIDQNMGLIRPKLKNGKAVVTLPICESTSMNWVIRLIVKDYKSQLYFIEYNLLTSN